MPQKALWITTVLSAATIPLLTPLALLIPKA